MSTIFIAYAAGLFIGAPVGAWFVLLSILGDHYEPVDLWRAWRRGRWPTLARLHETEVWLAEAWKGEVPRDR